MRIAETYGEARAAKFCKSASAWRPHLEIWRWTLDLINRSAELGLQIHPGFVLDDGYGALTSLGDRGAALIHVHPDHLQEAITRYRQRPLHVGAFLHSVACHELAHANGLMGQGHSPAFVRARRELGDRTAALVPTIAAAAIQKLGLGPLQPSSPKAIAAAREAVCGDTSADCRECSSSKACSIEALPRSREKLQRLVDRLSAEMRARPPRGFSSRDVERFFAQNESAILEMAEQLVTSL